MRGIMVISKLFAEGKISEDDRGMLKEMVFKEDTLLMHILSSEDDIDDSFEI